MPEPWLRVLQAAPPGQGDISLVSSKSVGSFLSVSLISPSNHDAHALPWLAAMCKVTGDAMLGRGSVLAQPSGPREHAHFMPAHP